jgi:hypothetical protein
MTIKNNYIKESIIWAIFAVSDGICCAISFIEGNLGFGFLCLISSMAFCFVLGALVEKAIRLQRIKVRCKKFISKIEEIEYQKVDYEVPFPEVKEKNKNAEEINEYLTRD